jgi:hypothetical protein
MLNYTTKPLCQYFSERELFFIFFPGRTSACRQRLCFFAPSLEASDDRIFRHKIIFRQTEFSDANNFQTFRICFSFVLLFVFSLSEFACCYCFVLTFFQTAPVFSDRQNLRLVFSLFCLLVNRQTEFACCFACCFNGFFRQHLSFQTGRICFLLFFFVLSI